MPRKNPLVEVLEAVFWGGKHDVQRVILHVRHRGAPGDVREVTAAEVVRFDRGWIFLPPRKEPGMGYADEIPVPLHRVLKVVDGRDGRVLYEKKGRNE